MTDIILPRSKRRLTLLEAQKILEHAEVAIKEMMWKKAVEGGNK